MSACDAKFTAQCRNRSRLRPINHLTLLGAIVAEENVVVASKLKAAVKGLDLRMDGTLPDAINAKVHAMLADAAARAKANNRGTLRPHDL